MPTYQYACTACDHRFETVQSFSDASLTECPTCSGTLRKVFSSVGIVFKGSGFYRTDSRAGAVGAVANGSGENGTKSENGATGEKSADKSAGKVSEKSSTTSSNGSTSGKSESSSSPAPAAAARS